MYFPDDPSDVKNIVPVSLPSFVIQIYPRHRLFGVLDPAASAAASPPPSNTSPDTVSPPLTGHKRLRSNPIVNEPSSPSSPSSVRDPEISELPSSSDSAPASSDPLFSASSPPSRKRRRRLFTSSPPLYSFPITTTAQASSSTSGSKKKKKKKQSKSHTHTRCVAVPLGFGRRSRSGSAAEEFETEDECFCRCVFVGSDQTLRGRRARQELLTKCLDLSSSSSTPGETLSVSEALVNGIGIGNTKVSPQEEESTESAGASTAAAAAIAAIAERKKVLKTRFKKDPFLRKYVESMGSRSLFLSNLDPEDLGIHRIGALLQGQFGNPELVRGFVPKTRNRRNRTARRVANVVVSPSQSRGRGRGQGGDGVSDFLSRGDLFTEIQEAEAEPRSESEPTRDMEMEEWKGYVQNLARSQGRCVSENEVLDAEQAATEWMREFDVLETKDRGVMRDVRGKKDAQGWTHVVPKSGIVDAPPPQQTEDADGWTVVGPDEETEDPLHHSQDESQASRKRGVGRIGRKARKSRERRKKRKAFEKEKYSVYEFERDEKKRQKLLAIRQRFEEERKRIEILKRRRQFTVE